MTYQEYFRQAEFNEVWKTLRDVYGESEDTKPLYEAVFEAVREMEEDKLHSSEKIEVNCSRNGEVYIQGAPDPQEWLVSREVNIEFSYKDTPIPDINNLTGHLLYWSTLYGIKTHKLQSEGFSKWLDYGMRGPFYTLPDNDPDKIGEGVMVKYIFLDFDGVLNTEQYQAKLAIECKPMKDDYGPLFDPKAVARLSEIIDATKAEILIISSWGEVLGRDKIIEMWEKRGLPGEVSTVFIPDEKCNSKAQWIKECLDRRIFLPYVILDDESQFLPEQEQCFIRVNPVTGISEENVEWSIDILNELDNLPPSAFDDLAYEEERNRISHINNESCVRKKLRYWKSTILNDEAYDWSWNFTILHKKLEYNIGYYRFTQRYVGWENDVERMVLACRLIEIATTGISLDDADTYVNIRNCERFKMKPTEFEDSEFLDLHKEDLRAEKAYQLVWTVFRQNMKKWWD